MLSLFVEKIIGGIIGMAICLFNGIGAILFLFLCFLALCAIITYFQIFCLKYWNVNPIYELKKLYHKYCD